jgi:hypothetical protein
VRICIILFTEPPFSQSRNKNEEINKISKFKILVKVGWLLLQVGGGGQDVDKSSPSICLGQNIHRLGLSQNQKMNFSRAEFRIKFYSFGNHYNSIFESIFESRVVNESLQRVKYETGTHP